MDETTVLISRLQNGETELREVLVEKNMGLVHHVAKRFVGRGTELEDLIQIGCIGLIKAIDKFDLKFDVKFSTYAVPLIAGEIKRFLRDDGMVKVSRNLKENHFHITRFVGEYQKKFGRDPTMTEISEATKLTMEEIVMALESGCEIESIYKQIYQNDGNEIYLVDQVVAGNGRKGIGGIYFDSADAEKEQLLNRVLIKMIMTDLSEEEKKLIFMRYYEDKTQSAVAAVLGMSQVQVSRLEKKILLRLRKHAMS